MPLTSNGRHRLSEAMKARWESKRSREHNDQQRATLTEELWKLHNAALCFLEDEQLKTIIAEELTSRDMIRALEGTNFGKIEAVRDALQKQIVVNAGYEIVTAK